MKYVKLANNCISYVSVSTFNKKIVVIKILILINKSNKLTKKRFYKKL